MVIKSIKFSDKAATAVFQVDGDNYDKSEVVALALLTGAYNPLRVHSVDQRPINMERLKALQGELRRVLSDTIAHMNVDIRLVAKL